MDSDGAGGLPSGVPQENGYKYQPSTRLVATKDGFIQFTTTLLEEKIIERAAMKAPPKKSALDGAVNAAASMDVANELLNEMQRNGGGGIVTGANGQHEPAITRAGRSFKTNV